MKDPLFKEREVFIAEQKFVDDLAEDALNSACEVIQEKLGVTDGGFAGHFFSDGFVKNLLKKYIEEEMYLNGISFNNVI
jgi:hypothetical protein